MENANLILKKYFGYDNFRPGQDEIIKHIINSEDVLGIMPTGAGKSICYQVPAMIFEGITIVISPLISLMKDQVDNLNDIGIPSAYLNSSLSSSDYFQTIQNIKLNMYKIIYVAPERLEQEGFINLLNSLNISMITIDEAHCVSQWGHDFRPSYREIANIILNLKRRPIVSAFTATATELVKNDIIDLLHLNSPYTLVTGFDRKNLYFSVETPKSRKDYVLDFLEHNKNDAGIIYCSTRKTVDSLYLTLKENGYNVSKYHGGMTEKSRSNAQNDFTYDKTTIMIATNAFGMGIDKSNIRYVIHYNMPKDLESYYQEAGRAGRDGDNAKCILLFSRADIITNKILIESIPGIHKVEYDKLNDIVDYCNTDKCLRKYILEYFNEQTDFDNCDNCGNCLSQIETTDITTDSQKILSCIKRMNEKFGSGVVTDVLKGSNSAKIRSFKFDTLSTYGIMKDYSKDTIKDLIYFLITEGYIESVGDKYPILKLSPTSNQVLFGNEKILIKKKIEKEKLTRKNKNEENYDINLFAKLKQLRMQIAEKNCIPPFIVFADISLKEMATYYPIDNNSFLEISGVGNSKLEKYGDKFIKLINEYVLENNIIIPEKQIKISSTEKKSENTTNSISKEKIETRILTYNLYKSGKTIQEICLERNLSRQTIEKHLISCLESGFEINLENNVNKQYETQIKEAILKLGSDKLKPIKDFLPNDVSYFDIQYYIALEKLK